MEQVAADLNRQMVPKNETLAAVISELKRWKKSIKIKNATLSLSFCK